MVIGGAGWSGLSPSTMPNDPTVWLGRQSGGPVRGPGECVQDRPDDGGVERVKAVEQAVQPQSPAMILFNAATRVASSGSSAS
jgi:hypothetical protein